MGFVRVHAPAGTSTRVVLPVDLAPLDVRIDGRWRREPGVYRLRIGQRAGDADGVQLDVPVA